VLYLLTALGIDALSMAASTLIFLNQKIVVDLILIGWHSGADPLALALPFLIPPDANITPHA